MNCTLSKSDRKLLFADLWFCASNVEKAIAKYSASEYKLKVPRAIRHSGGIFETDASASKTIGLVLCRSRNDLIVEYALSDIRRPIGVSTHQLGLPPVEQLQAKLQKLLALSRNAKKTKPLKRR